MKIYQKVAFNIASEASYVYILSGQKFIKKPKNGPFWITWNLRSILIGQKFVKKKAKLKKLKCDILGNFQTLWGRLYFGASCLMSWKSIRCKCFENLDEGCVKAERSDRIEMMENPDPRRKLFYSALTCSKITS